MAGPYDIAAAPTCYHAWVRWVAVIALASAVAQAGPPVDLRAQSQLSLQHVKRLEDGRVEVTGTLVDKLTGDPLRDQRVTIAIGEEQTSALTAEDGSFRGVLSAEDGQVEIRLSTRTAREIDPAAPLSVTTDPSRSQVELTISKLAETPTGVKLKVVATGDEGPIDLPVQLALAPVAPGAADAPFRPLRQATTNSDVDISRAEAGGPGIYRLQATFAGDDIHQKATADTTLELASATTTTLAIKKTAFAFEDTIVVTGNVSDDDHKSVRAAVTLSAGDKRLAQGATEADGSYRFKIEADLLGQGEWTLQAAADPGSASLRASRSDPQTIKVAPPQPVPVSYTIAAFVATALAAGGFFAARTKPWKRFQRMTPPAEVPRTEGEVEVGRGGLVVAKPGIVSTLRRASDDGFSGVVRDSVRGRPVPHAVVRLMLGEAEREIRTAADGSFAIERLDGGDWQAEVAAIGHVTERFVVTLPHRGELRGVRVDLVPVRERVFQLYRRAAEPVLPEPRLWGVWSPRQIVDHVRARRPSPALAELTDFVEEVYFSPRVMAETVLAQASERVDRAIHERTRVAR